MEQIISDAAKKNKTIILISALLDYSQLHLNLQKRDSNDLVPAKIRDFIVDNKMKLSPDVPLAFTLMEIAHKKLLQNSAEKYMHRKYFKELMLQHSLAKATMYQEVGDIHMGAEQIKQIVTIASTGSSTASDVNFFRVRSCVN